MVKKILFTMALLVAGGVRSQTFWPADGATPPLPWLPSGAVVTDQVDDANFIYADFTPLFESLMVVDPPPDPGGTNDGYDPGVIPTNAWQGTFISGAACPLPAGVTVPSYTASGNWLTQEPILWEIHCVAQPSNKLAHVVTPWLHHEVRVCTGDVVSVLWPYYTTQLPHDWLAFRIIQRGVGFTNVDIAKMTAGANWAQWTIPDLAARNVQNSSPPFWCETNVSPICPAMVAWVGTNSVPTNTPGTNGFSGTNTTIECTPSLQPSGPDGPFPPAAGHPGGGPFFGFGGATPTSGIFAMPVMSVPNPNPGDPDQVIGWIECGTFRDKPPGRGDVWTFHPPAGTDCDICGGFHAPGTRFESETNSTLYILPFQFYGLPGTNRVYVIEERSSVTNAWTQFGGEFTLPDDDSVNILGICTTNRAFALDEVHFFRARMSSGN